MSIGGLGAARPGERLGAWVIDSVLGQGGMGVVYRARHAASGQPVALKTLRPGADPRMEARLRREARAIGQLVHPGIVRLIDASTAPDGRLLLALELVEGRSLLELIRARAIAPADGARVVAEAARAVHHAHERGILHRDLKPENIIVTAEGRAKVLDFGLAKGWGRDALEASQSLTADGALVGTICYMSPEQLDGAELSAAADVYGLGATLYEAIARRQAFAGPSPAHLIAAITMRMPDPPSSSGKNVPALEPGIARRLDALCLRAMAKEPADRPASAAALADEIERALAGGGESGSAAVAPRSRSSRIAAVRSARRGGRAGAAVALGAVALVAALGAWVCIDAFREAAPPEPPPEPIDLVREALAEPDRLLAAGDPAGAIAAFDAVAAKGWGTLEDRAGRRTAEQSEVLGRLRFWTAAWATARDPFGEHARVALEQAQRFGSTTAPPALALAERIHAVAELCLAGTPPAASEALADPVAQVFSAEVRDALAAIADARALVGHAIRAQPPPAPITGLDPKHVRELCTRPAQLHRAVLAATGAARGRLAAAPEWLQERALPMLARLDRQADLFYGASAFRLRFDDDDAPLWLWALRGDPAALAVGDGLRHAPELDAGAYRKREAELTIVWAPRFWVIEARVGSEPGCAPSLGFEVGKGEDDPAVPIRFHPDRIATPRQGPQELLRQLWEEPPEKKWAGRDLFARVRVTGKSIMVGLHAPTREKGDIPRQGVEGGRVRLHLGRGSFIRELVLVRQRDPSEVKPGDIARGRTGVALATVLENQVAKGDLKISRSRGGVSWKRPDALAITSPGARVTTHVDLPAERPARVLLGLHHTSTIEVEGSPWDYAPVTIVVNDRVVIEDFYPNGYKRRDVIDITDFVGPGKNEVELRHPTGVLPLTHYWLHGIEVAY